MSTAVPDAVRVHYEERKRALREQYDAGEIDLAQLRAGLMDEAREGRELAEAEAATDTPVAPEFDAIATVYAESRDALRARLDAGEITVEEYRDQAIGLAKEARRRADSVRTSVEHRRDKLDRLVALGARWGWAQDEAGEWRMYVEVDSGYWMPMP